MKGNILGAHAEGGTISAQDGKRYKFDLMQWNSDRPPSVGQEVDFVVETEGRAAEVFPLKSGGDLVQAGESVKASFEKVAASDAGGRLIALATGNPAFQISVGVLIASLFFTFAKIGNTIPGATQALPHEGNYTALNISDYIDYVKLNFSTLVQAAERWKSVVDSTGGAANILGLAGNPDAIINTFKSLDAITNLLYLIYLPPIGALVTIVQAIRRKPIGIPAFATGVGCIVAFASLIIWRMIVTSAITSAGNPAIAQIFTDSVHFGLGAYLILVCGCVLLATAFGFIRLPQKA